MKQSCHDDYQEAQDWEKYQKGIHRRNKYFILFTTFCFLVLPWLLPWLVQLLEKK